MSNAEDQNGKDSTLLYVQVVPLYNQNDKACADFFGNEDNIKELNALSGVYAQIFLADEIKKGDFAGFYEVIHEGKRYPGVRTDSLPCLWVEDGKGGQAWIKLEGDQDALRTTFRTVVEEAKTADSAQAIADELKPRTEGDPVAGQSE